MENILHDFNEKVINLVGNCLKNSITEKGISDFTNDLEKEMIKLGKDITQFIVEFAENIIFNLKDRKEKFESLEKDKRTIISILLSSSCLNVTLKRRLRAALFLCVACGYDVLMARISTY